jgi:hypothetical protein
MRFALTTVAAAIATSQLVTAHTRSFGIARPSFFNHKSVQSSVQQLANAVSLDSTLSLPRGGAVDEVEGETAEEPTLYLPGLLEASVSGKWVSAHILLWLKKSCTHNRSYTNCIDLMQTIRMSPRHPKITP